MRLQLSIHRHTLPPTHILFTTGSGPASKTTSPSATVADFLYDVNSLVPLESEAGTWGLEDYVVELQATADQEKWYECLHYQEVTSVFRDDDEVLIRPLSTEEIRERRLGGRFQVSRAGRHLIDGVAWGRNWLRVEGRPPITIPPRKRRRLETDLAESEEEMGLLEAAVNQSERGLIVAHDEDDDEDDQDYVAEDEDGSEVDETEDTEDDHPKQVTALAHFDDADASDDADAAMDTFPEAPRELKALQDEAAELQESESKRTPRRRKRKRAANDEGGEDDFEGFSTPAKSQMDANDAGGGWTFESGSDSDDSSESDSDGSGDETSSSGTSSDSDTDEDMTSDGEVDSSSETSSSEFSSGDSSDEETQSATSGQPVPKSVSGTSTHVPTVTATQVKLQQSAPGQGLRRTHANNSRAARKRRLNRLKTLGILPENANFQDLEAHDTEEQGDTSQCAPADEDENVEEKKRELLEQLHVDTETPANILMNDAPTDLRGPLETQVDDSSSGSARHGQPDSREDIKANVAADTGACTDLPRAAVVDEVPEPPQKRARLDTASSRRMIFGSLGLKTPETPAAERELRERLAASTTRTPKHVQSDEQAEGTQVEKRDVWQDRINLMAIECEQEGVTLSEPPFPFRQGWNKGVDSREKKSKRNGRKAKQFYADEHAQDAAEAQQEDHYAAGVSTLHGQMQVANEDSHITDESRTLSLEKADEDDMPRPENIDDLPGLSSDDANTGAVIAFKEYEMVHYQPQISPYRIARILESTRNGNDHEVKLRLSKRDWRKPPDRKYDPASGKRIYSLIDSMGEEEDPDDGIRVLSFVALFSPRLVQASLVQVPASGQIDRASESPSQSMPGSAVVPESRPFDVVSPLAEQPVATKLIVQQLDISTPRRHEITTMIKDTGFDSALDDRLLEPLADPQSLSRRRHASQAGSPAQEADKNATAVAESEVHVAAVNQSRSASPRLNIWSSSPAAQQASEVDEVTPKGSVSYLDVNYPPVSQLNIDSSGISAANSSSHQDAQRVTDAVDVDTSNLRSQYDDDDDKENDEDDFYTEDVTRLNDEPDHDLLFDSLKPDVPASPDEDAVATSSQTSFLGGLDGHISSEPEFETNREDDYDDDDSTGLPIWRGLTSSQVQKITRTSRSARVSPPAVKRNLRSRRTRKPKSSAALDAGSQGSRSPEVKTSQSQRRTPSQIPAGTQVVDLTIASSPVSPSGSDTDFLAGRKRGSRRVGKGPPKASSSITSSMASGLGNKRLLKQTVS